MSQEEKRIDKVLALKAFERIGQILQRRRQRAEIAVYGGTALLLSFDEARETTRDADVSIRSGDGAFTAAQFEVADDWDFRGVG